MSTGTYRDTAVDAMNAGSAWQPVSAPARPSALLALLLGDFALLGMTIGVQGVLWASLMSAIGVGKAAFGTAQLGAPLISIVLLLLGGQLATAVGKKRLGMASLVVASILLVMPGGLWMAIAGFGLLGLAVAGVVPTAISAAARLVPGSTGAIAGAMLASVYVSFMILPPLLGWLAETFSLRAALSTVGLSGLGILWLARGVTA